MMKRAYIMQSGKVPWASPSWWLTSENLADEDKDSACKRTPDGSDSGDEEAGMLTHDDKQEAELVLLYIQPGVAGLMDGLASILGLLLVTAYSTRDTYQTFVIGFGATIAAGLSMGWTEACADDGHVSGRGSPVKRGLSCGIMTMAGGLSATLPFLLHEPNHAIALSITLTLILLLVAAYLQVRYMQTQVWLATLQVVGGGLLVISSGILIGHYF